MIVATIGALLVALAIPILILIAGPLFRKPPPPLIDQIYGDLAARRPGSAPRASRAPGRPGRLARQMRALSGLVRRTAERTVRSIAQRTSDPAQRGPQASRGRHG